MNVQFRKVNVGKCLFLIAFLLTGAIAFAQTRISGTVTDSQGEPLVGASVRANDAVNGVVTDIDGKYLIQVSDAAKSLVFSYIGYQAKDEPINGRNVINVTMREDNKLLDEVVVVGYGTMQRKDVTSSITTVKAEDLNIGAYTDPAQLLQGKVPGLSIVQSSDPNAGTTSVTLRGASTLNSSTAPLYVVDGIPGVDLSLISPDDIESIDVLRDASATAIYGSKAANGVIIVTTKKGSQETQNVTYSAYVSWEKIMKHLDVMSADEMRAYAKANNITLDDDQGADTNWADVVSRTGFAHNHNLAISGGKGSTAYTASVNYMERDGVIKNTGMDRVIARAMVNGSVLKDHLTFTLGVNGSISNHWGVPTGINGGTGVNGGTSVFDAMYYYSPLVPVTNADGSWFNNSSYVSQSYNPMSLINEHQSKTTNKRLQLLGKVSLKIIDGLLLNANFSYQNQNWLYKEYITSKSQFDKRNGATSRNTSESIAKNMEIYANYDKTFNDVHKLSLMAGYSWEQQDNGDGFGAATYNFYNDDLLWYNIGLGNSKDQDCIWANTLTTLRMISFYARANYSYDSRYILQAAVRRDGSSAFGKNNEWATFPSVSAAWRIAEEGFLKDTGIFDDLKVRVGYGVSGNMPGFDWFISRFMYSGNGWATYTDALGNQALYHRLGAWRNANPDLKWESTKMLNVGLDFAFFNGRLNGTIEYYNKNTDDMIFDYSVSPNRYPVNWMTANVGSMRNRGIEVTINAVPVQTRDFSWSTSLNLSHNSNKVAKISNQNFSVDYIDRYNPDVAGTSTNIVRIIEGQPIGTFYMWEWAGYDDNDQSVYYSHDPETGERLKDDAGQYIVTADPTDKDRTIVGCAQPKLQLGWNNNLSYKNWNLNAFFTGTFGNKIFNELEAYYSNTTLMKTGKNCLSSIVTDQRAADAHAQWPSDRYLSNGSYFRLASLTISYDFRNCFNGWIKNLNLHATCNNVFTITSYSGRDPEINLGGLEPGIDSRKTQYPRTRQFIVGATISF